MFRKKKTLLDATGSLLEFAEAECVIVDGQVVKCRYPLNGTIIITGGKTRWKP